MFSVRFDLLVVLTKHSWSTEAGARIQNTILHCWTAATPVLLHHATAYQTMCRSRESPSLASLCISRLLTYIPTHRHSARDELHRESGCQSSYLERACLVATTGNRLSSVSRLLLLPLFSPADPWDSFSQSCRGGAAPRGCLACS